jgi:DNA-binding Lrp family transcriptional regulator
MNNHDQALLEALQFDFPLVSRPFKVIGERTGRSESSIISSVKRLKEEKIVRQISAIFDSAKIGYTSTLAAFEVPAARIETVADALSALPGVSHNYQREGAYNLWFTLTLRANKNLEHEIARLARKNNVSAWLYLPSLRQFKVSFRLPMGSRAPARPPHAPVAEPTASPRRISRKFVQELQKDLPVCSRPFLAASRRLGTTEPKLLADMQKLVDARVARRFAAVLRQTKAGFAANVMVAWAPRKNQKEKLGMFAASLPLVSHCYERPASREWPYSIYTMIHGKTMSGCRRIIKKISHESGVTAYQALKTVREFKKQRVQYFAAQ